jgi:hypothetical protein
MAKITKHGGASHDPWPLRGLAAERVGEDGPEVMRLPPESSVERVDGDVNDVNGDDDESPSGTVDIAEEEPVQIPKGNASHAEWAAFVRHQEGYPGDPEEATRNDLRDWWTDTHGSADTDSVAAGDAAETGPPAGDSAATGGSEADDSDEADDG